MSPDEAADLGIDALAAHVPELRAGRGWLIGLMALVSAAGGTAVMLLVDRLWPAWAGAGQVVVMALGFTWASQFFMRREVYRSRWGETA